MTRYALGLALVGLLALGFGGGARADAEDDKAIKAAQADALALAKESEAGKVDPAKLAAFRKKHGDLLHVMTVYKPVKKGGLDYEKVLVRDLGGRELVAKMVLQSKQADFLKLGHVVKVVAHATKLYPAPKKPKVGKKEWDKYNDDQAKAADEFLDAVKKLDPKGVKAAAMNINAACNICHSDFRDAD